MGKRVDPKCVRKPRDFPIWIPVIPCIKLELLQKHLSKHLHISKQNLGNHFTWISSNDSHLSPTCWLWTVIFEFWSKMQVPLWTCLSHGHRLGNVGQQPCGSGPYENAWALHQNMTAKLLYSHQTVASKLASAVDCLHRHPPLMSCSWLPVWNDTVVHSDFKRTNHARHLRLPCIEESSRPKELMKKSKPALLW